MLVCVLQQKERRRKKYTIYRYFATSFNGSANNFSEKIIESNDDSCIAQLLQRQR